MKNKEACRFYSLHIFTIMLQLKHMQRDHTEDSEKNLTVKTPSDTKRNSIKLLIRHPSSSYIKIL